MVRGRGKKTKQVNRIRRRSNAADFILYKKNAPTHVEGELFLEGGLLGDKPIALCRSPPQ